MFIPNAIYRKLRFPFKFLRAAIKYPAANARVKQYQVMSPEETIDLLLNDPNLSICRYGDGELEMTLYKNIGFQPFDERLSSRLKEILQRGVTRTGNCLICMPDAYRSTKNMRSGSALFWFFHKSFFFRNYEPLLSKTYRYGNTSVTRPYHDYKDKSLAPRIFAKFKRLITDKRILIVEGSGTRLGIGNDLLDSARQISRITTLNRNAFSVYENLYSAVLGAAKDYELVLISLGPTATLLAWDLSQQGVRCIDTGHIDIEYEWMRSAAKDKMKVEGKNVNEVGVLLSENSSPMDEAYRRQILLHVGGAPEIVVAPDSH
ncbi:GT-D fold domain-containing glycosyltransferase [Pantoea sp.]|uniref:GT-D fold domain-containing glycosyltransferase n=1 Tax=Pantoea sp. TaxID=69393 RepID=UPI00289F7F14|nr:GT-D fold domain-containing glycosyltransferase [Pantoea sp.]